jgi:protein involved in polysaccharide export with SLBB domain
MRVSGSAVRPGRSMIRPALLWLLASCAVPRAAVPSERLAPPPAVTAGTETRIEVRIDGVVAPSLPTEWSVSTRLVAEVGEDGLMRVPGCDAFDARGLSEVQLVAALEQHGLAKLFPGGRVNVSFIHNPRQNVSVSGQVTHPGALRWVPGMTMVQALTMAGGFTSSARRLVTITSGERPPLEVDVEAILTGDSPDVRLLPLDEVVVQ